MSSVVRTATPFTNRELLLKALDSVGCRHTVQGNEIVTGDYNRRFSLQGGRYVFTHEQEYSGYWGNINMQQYRQGASSFLADVGRQYNDIYRKQQEELERKRLAAIAEQERIRKQLEEQERIRQEQERLHREKLAEEERLHKERLHKEMLAEQERLHNERLVEQERLHKERLVELERLHKEQMAEQERLHNERLSKEKSSEQENIKLLAKADGERKKAEEEKQRLERERKEYVEKQRASIIAMAKEQGYDIQEVKVDNKIKLVLVQTTY